MTRQILISNLNNFASEKTCLCSVLMYANALILYYFSEKQKYWIHVHLFLHFLNR